MSGGANCYSFLESMEPAWKESDHPELAKGAAQWVRKLRSRATHPGAGRMLITPIRQRPND